MLVNAALAATTGLLYALAAATRRRVPSAGSQRWRPRSVASAGMRTLAVASAVNGAVLGMIGVVVLALGRVLPCHGAGRRVVRHRTLPAILLVAVV